MFEFGLRRISRASVGNYSEIKVHVDAASAEIAAVASKIAMIMIKMSRSGLGGAVMLGTSVSSVWLSTLVL